MSAPKSSSKDSSRDAIADAVSSNRESLAERDQSDRAKATLEGKLARLEENLSAGPAALGMTVDEAKQLLCGYLQQCESYSRKDLTGNKEAVRLLGAVRFHCKTELDFYNQKISRGVSYLNKIGDLMFSLELSLKTEVPRPAPDPPSG